MLLVLTGSRDGTCDLLFNDLKDGAFRFNVDIFQDYRVEFGSDDWLIENPTGKIITSKTATRAHWWKAFNFTTQSDGQYVTEEVKYVFRELYNWFSIRGWARGNPPHFHASKGKLVILEVARRFFVVPKFLAGWGLSEVAVARMQGSTVAKSLTSGLINTDKVLYTTEVDPSRLDQSYPWFLQERIDADADVTVQLCGERLFAFSRNRAGLSGLDWRQEIFTPNHHRARWIPRSLTADEEDAIRGFGQSLDVEWGRLDLMQRGDDLVFLEFNANGQWAFLDEDGQAGLREAVITYLTT